MQCTLVTMAWAVALTTFTQSLPAQRAPARAAAGQAVAPEPMKGIWEPVSYAEDVELNGVYFVTGNEGWATGGNGTSAGVLLHTVDAGAHWEVVLGDPAGSQRPFYEPRFVDRTTGFVAQKTGVGDHQLLRTVDGKNWTVSGTVPQHHTDYRFVSATDGVASTGQSIVRTTDGGRTWKDVYDCTMKMQVQGLARTVRCHVDAFAFPSPAVGYAIGGSNDARGLYVFRTGDGGASWTGALAVPGDDDGREGHLFFTSEQVGYACTAKGTLFGTNDAGATWTGLPGASCESKAPLLFADPEVGWAFRYQTMTFTTNGGRRWLSRKVALPAPAIALSLPRRDRAYVVGPHGMVYRYSVVPASTVAANSLAAPLLPGIATALEADVARLSTGFDSLDVLVQSTATPSPAAPSARTAAGGVGQSPFIANCCGKSLGTLDLVMQAVSDSVPVFVSRYRNVNLLRQGLRTAEALPSLSDSLRTAFRSFRSATDRPSARTALSGVKHTLASMKAAVDTAMQRRR